MTSIIHPQHAFTQFSRLHVVVEIQTQLRAVSKGHVLPQNVLDLPPDPSPEPPPNHVGTLVVVHFLQI